MTISKKTIFMFLGAAGLIFGNSASAANEPASETDQQNSQGLTEFLYFNNVIRIGADSKTIEINTTALLKLLKDDVDGKLKSSNLTQNDKEIYEQLKKSLKPGNFERLHLETQNLQSMDFSKGSAL